MPRPKCHRRIGHRPRCCCFRPHELDFDESSESVLSADEAEAIRLADYEGMYHEKAAELMGISRQTFGRIIESARRKVAEALVEGKILRIEQGEDTMTEKRTFKCRDCNHEWQVPFGAARPDECPSCKSTNFHRVEDERGHAGGGRRRRHGGACLRESKASKDE